MQESKMCAKQGKGEEKKGPKTQQETEIRIENTAGSNSPEVEMAKVLKEQGHLDIT